MLFCLVTWLCYVNPYFLYVFLMVMFIISGKMIRIIFLLYCVISTYDMITSLVINLGWYFYTSLL